MRFIICLSFIMTALVCFSQEKEIINGQVNKDILPIPHEKNQLFYLQRDPDINTIIYALNIDSDGLLNRSNPVLAYWVRYADQGQTEKLSFIQRKMAYGIHHKELAPNVYELHVQAYKPLKIILSKNEKTEKYQALVNINDKKILLNRIFVRINGGSLFKPNVQYIEICGHNTANGKEINYRYDL